MYQVQNPDGRKKWRIKFCQILQKFTMATVSYLLHALPRSQPVVSNTGRCYTKNQTENWVTVEVQERVPLPPHNREGKLQQPTAPRDTVRGGVITTLQSLLKFCHTATIQLPPLLRRQGKNGVWFGDFGPKSLRTGKICAPVPAPTEDELYIHTQMH